MAIAFGAFVLTINAKFSRNLHVRGFTKNRTPAWSRNSYKVSECDFIYSTFRHKLWSYKISASVILASSLPSAPIFFAQKICVSGAKRNWDFVYISLYPSALSSAGDFLNFYEMGFTKHCDQIKFHILIMRSKISGLLSFSHISQFGKK